MREGEHYRSLNNHVDLGWREPPQDLHEQRVVHHLSIEVAKLLNPRVS